MSGRHSRNRKYSLQRHFIEKEKQNKTQNPLCLWTCRSDAVQQRYFTRRFMWIGMICEPVSCSRAAHLGRMIFSLGWSEAKSLKVLNLTEGGWRKGLAPKLNSHCWYDIKLAAAKKPDLRGKESPDAVHFEGQSEAVRKGAGKNRAKRRSKKMLDYAYVAEENTCFSGGSWCPFR